RPHSVGRWPAQKFGPPVSLRQFHPAPAALAAGFGSPDLSHSHGVRGPWTVPKLLNSTASPLTRDWGWLPSLTPFTGTSCSAALRRFLVNSRRPTTARSSLT